MVNYQILLYNAFLDSISFNILFAALGYVIWFPVFYNQRGKKEIINILVTHFLAAAIIISLWLTAAEGLINALRISDEQYTRITKSALTWRIPLGVLYYVMITLTYYTILFYKDLNNKIHEEAELQRLVTETELRSLRSQINPHFLFNSLNSINTLTIIEPEKAQQMIIKLSEYMRYSLRKDKSVEVPLRDELDNIRLYLDIEKTRFGNKLVFNITVNNELEEIPIPHMILQPLVENAVKYGVYESIDKNVLDIEITRNDIYLVIAVMNGFDPQLQSNGEGIGLTNIRKRLILLYQQQGLLKTNIKNNKFTAILQIPINA